MRHLAFEITKNGVWLATGSVSGGKIALNRLLFQTVDSGQSANAILAEMVKSIGAKGAKATAVIRRAETEVRVTNLPSSELNELPDMVRFSASRLFAVAGDTWPIDFLLLPKSRNAPDTEDGIEQTSVLVMATAPSVISQLKNASQAAGLELQSVMLAPVVVANALLRCNEVDVNENKPFLVADGYEAGTELTICEHGKVHFLRNVRTPFDLGAESVKACAGEIRRTSMAAADSEVPASFNTVVATNTTQAQGDALSKLIETPVLSCSFNALVNTDRLPASDSEHLAKTGWLATALSLTETPTDRPNRPIDSREVDFLNPRHAIVKERSLPQMIGIGGGIGFLILSMLAWYFLSHRSLNNQIAELQRQIEENKTNVLLSQGLIANRKEIEAFIDTRINWLDELAYISSNALPADQALIETFQATTLPTNGDGKIVMNVNVVEQAKGPEFEKALRGDKHVVTSPGWKESINKSSPYPFSGPTVISIQAGAKTEWTPIITPVSSEEQTPKASDQPPSSDSNPEDSPMIEGTDISESSMSTAAADEVQS